MVWYDDRWFNLAMSVSSYRKNYMCCKDVWQDFLTSCSLRRFNLIRNKRAQSSSIHKKFADMNLQHFAAANSERKMEDINHAQFNRGNEPFVFLKKSNSENGVL
jgi:hypothetical protein